MTEQKFKIGDIVHPRFESISQLYDTMWRHENGTVIDVFKLPNGKDCYEVKPNDGFNITFTGVAECWELS